MYVLYNKYRYIILIKGVLYEITNYNGYLYITIIKQDDAMAIKAKWRFYT